MKILHMYYDLLNLNGEQGNIKVLTNILKDNNIKYEIDNLSVGDNIDILKYDLLYMGKGSFENIKIVLRDILKYKSDLKKFIDDNKFLLATGNSHELFGKYIINNKIRYDALNIFDYYTEEINPKMVGDMFVSYDNLDLIIGFINTKRITLNNKYPLFKVLKPLNSLKEEGVKYNNFYGTYLLGPILVRNPELLDYLLKKLYVKYKPNKKRIEYLAYNEYINNFYKKDDIL